MTKTQIWVAAFLGLFIVLLGISRLTQNDAPSHPGGMPGMGSGSGEASSEQNALTLIKNNGCTSCHGSDLRGSNLGPSLVNLRENWNSRDELISYLRNPNSFMDKDRFREFKSKYSSVVMPPYNNLDIKDLGKIADYLLRL